MKKLELKDIEHAASILQGQTLETISGRARFRLEVGDDGLYYVLESNGNRRRQTWKNDIDRVIEWFNETNSFKTSEYSKISRCASYLLPIIRFALEN